MDDYSYAITSFVIGRRNKLQTYQTSNYAIYGIKVKRWQII